MSVSRGERIGLGIIAGLISVTPVAVLLGIVIAAVLNGLHTWLFEAAAVLTIIIAGLYLPVFLIVTHFAEQAAAESGVAFHPPNIREPFSPLALWWQYLRSESKNRPAA